MSPHVRSSRRTTVPPLLWLLVCAVLLAAAAASAADDAEELELDTEIVSATVYGRQAQIVRRGEVELTPGSFRLVCDDLPKKLIETSLNVEGSGVSGVRIVGIDMRRTRKDLSDSPRFKELSEQLEELDDQRTAVRVRQKGIMKRQELMRSLTQISGEQAKDHVIEGTFSTANWQAILAFVETEDIETETRLDESAKEMAELESDMSWIRSEIRAMQVGTGSGKEVVVDCESTSSGALTVELSYLVTDATWHPEYTVRYIERDSAIELSYAARIFQATGEDWEGVSTLLSTASPHVGAAPPELLPQYLGSTTGTLRGRVTDAATGSALPFASVVLKGTGFGAVTRADGTYVISEIPAGSYSVLASYIGFRTEQRSRVRVAAGGVEIVDLALRHEALAAEEVIVEAERPMMGVELTASRRALRGADEFAVRALATEAGVAERPPAAEHVEAEVLGSEFAANLVIPKAVDLETGAEPRRSLVVRERITGEFVLEAVPRLSEHVFVRGTLANPLGFPLLPGEAEVYVETVPEGSSAEVSNFVGKDRIGAVAPGETLAMYLGVDQNVKVEHELVMKEVLSKASDKKVKVRYSYAITVESFRRSPAEVWVIDRVPVTAMKDVEIDDLDVLPEPDTWSDNGLLTWKLALEPGERRVLTTEYVVEYPSHLSAKGLGLEE